MNKIATLFLLCLSFILFAQQKVDYIFKDAKIYTVNSNFDVAAAMAVSKGKIVGIGREKDILKKYLILNLSNTVNLKSTNHKVS